MKQICIKCGKEAEIDALCSECFLSQKELFSIENFVVNICRDCGFYGDGHVRGNEEEVIKELVKKTIVTKNTINKTEVTLKKFGNKYNATVTCYGYIKPCKKIKKEEKKIIVTVKTNKCDTCSKLSGGYYEAVIQVRGPMAEEIIKKIKALMPKDTTVLTSAEKTESGYDMKFIRKSDTSRIVRQLNKYEVKRSFKFVTTKETKKVYRNYYAVR